MKHMLWILLTVLLFGCALKGTEPASQADSAVLTEPPALSISVGSETVLAAQSSYSWIYPNGDGTETGVDACGMHPLEMLDLLTPLPLKGTDALTLSFALTDDQSLKSLTVCGWRTDDLSKMPTYDSQPDLKPLLTRHGAVVTATLPACVNAVYEVHATFDGTAHGDCHYAFCVTEKPASLDYSAESVRIGWSDEAAQMDVCVISDPDTLAEWLSMHAGQSFKPLTEIYVSYDTSFFMDHTLLIVPVEASSGSMRFSVEEVQREGSNVTVVIRREMPEVGTCDMAAWLLLISVPQGAVHSTDSIQIAYPVPAGAPVQERGTF